jgi:RNA polymerase II subunit A small phosphatase-like protein
LILCVYLQVVLDLDETLVCAYETSSLPAALRSQAIEAGLNWFDLECVSSDKVCYMCLIVYPELESYILTWACWIFKEGEGKPKINYVTVFERPGLKEFLSKLSKFADLVLFTAGLEGFLKILSFTVALFFFWNSV